MKTTLAISLFSLFCLSCSATDVAATSAPPENNQRNTAEINPDTRHKSTAGQSTLAQAPIHDPARTAAEAPQYSGAVGTIEGDRNLSEFLFAHDGEVVNLNLTTSTDSNHYGEDWLSLCAEASPSDNCTAVHINYVPATEYDIFWRSAAGTNTLAGFYIVRLNQGMNQGFLSISLLGMP